MKTSIRRNETFRARAALAAFFGAALWLVLATPNFAAAQYFKNFPKTLMIETEGFENKGGWALDNQASLVVGSPYLLAHGAGVPVADATTKVRFPSAGKYKLYVRTRNWVAPWKSEYAPGKFQVAVDGKKIATIFGTEGEPWAWQAGESVDISADKLEVEIALCDLTGFDGRADALVFTADEFVPPNDAAALKPLRAEALALPAEIPNAGDGKVYDLVVVGGGIAGTCAAISAARLGATVALVQNRGVLGGNGSSEIRVHLNGDVNLPPYPNLGNLTYLMGPHGGGNAREAAHYKDATRFELVSAEKNIDLFLNVQVDSVDAADRDGKRLIRSVCGTNSETGCPIRFLGKTFADCTGDGTVGFLAGADFRMGREARSEYGESTAPDVADDMTMGSSIQWNTEETDAETTFPELPWAIQFNEKTIKPGVHGDWDWEGGMNLDQIADIERIRDNGLRAAYGHWAYMKNRATGDWAEKVKNRKLGWVAFVAGKRESRRLLGDVVLKEQDIVDAVPFPDASVTTTWSIDLHYPEPSNAKAFPGEEFRAICEQVQIKPYAIPYRCFYSRNVDNLFMAGRDISVTHVALGTIRVMRTGGMMGEVVGMAASICKNRACLPRDVYSSHLEELKDLMTKGVAPATLTANALERPKWLPKDAKNWARSAKISVSSVYSKGPNYPKEKINDGKFDFSDNGGRWVSDVAESHWVDFEFAAPTTLDAARVASGQAGGKTPISDFRFQYEKDGKFVDVPGAKVENNESVLVGLKFARPVCATKFRLVATRTPENLARLWEVELYRVGK